MCRLNTLKKFVIFKIFFFFLLLIFIVKILDYIYLSMSLSFDENIVSEEHLNIDFDLFRNLNVSIDSIDELKKVEEKSGIDYITLLTLYMTLNKYNLLDHKSIKSSVFTKKNIKSLTNSNSFSELHSYYNSIFSDLKYFPIPLNKDNTSVIAYEDSWKNSRSYGGNRLHEGTDIMDTRNTRGYIPLLSVSDGVVEKLGWLEQGGYRIGIRGPSGAYFYYAHLYSYSPDIVIGRNIKAGELIGFMGDSGYGKEEGTIGQFPVHLHIGIYISCSGEDISVNPYWILKYLERYKLTFDY